MRRTAFAAALLGILPAPHRAEFGTLEGHVSILQDDGSSSVSGGKFKPPTSDKMGRVYDPKKLTAADWTIVEAEGGKDAIRNDGDGRLGKKEFAAAQKWNDAHPFSSTSADMAARASQRDGRRVSRQRKGGVLA